ncbi:MAG: response regulator [Enterobacteriaceae bacterium]
MLSEQHKILLIDDDLDILDAYSMLLQQAGYEIYRCNDPHKVPDLLPPNWPGVVICDVCMPSLSGLQLMEILLKKDRQLPVLLITGHGTIATAVEAVKKGAFEYLESPYNRYYCWNGSRTHCSIAVP